MKPKVTSDGYSAVIKALDGAGLTFSKFVLGNGEMPDDYSKLKNVVNPVAEVGLNGVTLGDQYAEVNGTISNSDIDTSFYWTEVGIFCTDGDTEMLYAYGHTDMSNEPHMYIPAAGEAIIELQLNYYIYIGEVDNVSAILSESATYATKANLNEHIENRENPHKVSAEQVGLGNVENVKTNDQTPTYKIANTLSGMTSGEKLSIAMGKIALAVSELIDHLKDNVKHITSDERKSWNSKAEGEHQHSASDINKGTLSVARGGTGVGSWKTNRVVYASGSSTLTQIDLPTVDSAVLRQDKSGSPYWAASTESGTYVGEGKSGSGQPNSIVFQNGMPHLILIKQTGSYGDRYGFLFLVNEVYSGFSDVGGYYSDLIVSCETQADGSAKVSWYLDSSESHPANQLDHNGHTFVYVAIF